MMIIIALYPHPSCQGVTAKGVHNPGHVGSRCGTSPARAAPWQASSTHSLTQARRVCHLTYGYVIVHPYIHTAEGPLGRARPSLMVCCSQCQENTLASTAASTASWHGVLQVRQAPAASRPGCLLHSLDPSLGCALRSPLCVPSTGPLCHCVCAMAVSVYACLCDGIGAGGGSPLRMSSPLRMRMSMSALCTGNGSVSGMSVMYPLTSATASTLIQTILHSVARYTHRRLARCTPHGPPRGALHVNSSDNVTTSAWDLAKSILIALWYLTTSVSRSIEYTTLTQVSQVI